MSALVTLVTMVMDSHAPTLTNVPPPHVTPMPPVKTTTVVSHAHVTLASPETDSHAPMTTSVPPTHVTSTQAALINQAWV